MSGAGDLAGHAKLEPACQKESPGTLALYPFIFSLYPVLFLYLHNIREVPWPDPLWAGIASLGIALVLWPFTRLFSRQAQKRALLLFLFLLLFHSYGLYHALASRLLPGMLPPLAAHALAFLLPGGVWLLLSLAVLRVRSRLAAISRILQAAVVFLLAWNLAGIILHHGRSFYEQARRQSLLEPTPATVRPGDPDIYCFVLDEFAGVEAARSLFGYDNSAFAAGLRRLGFFVARDSRSPFLKTEAALASFLNPGDTGNGGDPFPRIRRNEVAAFLKRRGYRIVEFPVSPAMFMEAADKRYYYSLTRVSLFFNDFYRTLFERSLLYFLPERWGRRQPDATRYYRERVLQVFEKFPAVLRIPGPKFVYVHLYAPHEPFVFNAQGGVAESGHFWDHADPRFYLQQYVFISSKMLETAAMILHGSKRPPVFIIQSDHGYRGSLGRKRWLRHVAATETQKVFNALLLPGAPLDKIDPSLSPLNNFRLVFNFYFGTAYLLLPNP